MTIVDGIRLIEPRSYLDYGYPHEEWTKLRGSAPVHLFEGLPDWPPFWAITKHADIREISRQPAVFINGEGMTLSRESVTRERGTSLPQMETIITMDPPKHRKFRAVGSPYFTPRAVGRIDELVARTARDLVDGLGAEGECDFVTEIASIYPLKIISRILGAPEEDEPMILALTNQLFGSEDPEFQRGEDHLENMKSLMLDFVRYFSKVAEDRRASPSDDLASVIANARIDGEPMGPQETLGYFLITFTAGHETTRGAISGGLHALIENPAALAQWRQQPDLTRSAIEEIMRYVTPVNTMVRTAAQAYELRGQKIREGDKLVLFYASANRDEEVFEAASEFRPDRDPNPHLAFGIGEHFCLGAHFARKTSSRIFHELVSRLEHVELAGEPQRVASNLVPGIKHLPIRYRLAPAA